MLPAWRHTDATCSLWDYPPALGKCADFEVIKRQWVVFYGTDPEMQLRRRDINTLVLCGICTNTGVESTARIGWEMGSR